MAARQPVATVDPHISSEGAAPVPWGDARARLGAAEVFWVSTVRPDGRPHVTPLIAVWLDDALYFTTGENECKAKNLEQNTHCILATGCNGLAEGLDFVVEGDAIRVSDDGHLQRVADAYEAKYGPDWRFTVKDGSFHHQGVRPGAVALVYELTPRKALGFFRKGSEYSQTRWTF